MTRVQLVLPFDRPGAHDFRLLQEAARLGEVHALLWSDRALRTLTGRKPALPEAERRYFLEAVRYVAQVSLVEAPAVPGNLPEATGPAPDLWVADDILDYAPQVAACATRALPYRVFRRDDLAGFPADPPERSAPGRRKVLVTGSFDWLHSGHVRFFEEVSDYGDLYAVVGHDRNIQLLKGDGHPLFPETERRFLVGALRYVKQALVSSGDGWLDAEPEIERLRPDIYAVNEDGDRPEKREYCALHGIDYLVLERTPKQGFAARSSTQLRGF
jgi:cytidyltransferase-like protein